LDGYSKAVLVPAAQRNSDGHNLVWLEFDYQGGGNMEITLKKGNISVTVKQDYNEFYHYKDLQGLARSLFQDLASKKPMYDTWNKEG
jgi:hypothetical protein